MESNLVQYKGLYCRPKTSDKKMVAECYDNYCHFNIDKNSIVVDFGGNIGAFGKMAVDSGCKELHIFEPEKSNIEMIELNLKKEFGKNSFIKIYQAAVSVWNKPTLIFYQADSGNKHCSGTISPISERAIAARKIRCEVPNRNINEVLKELQPTHLKVDIEGSEIDWIKENSAQVPDCVQEYFIEVHRRGDFFNEFDSKWFPKILERFDLIYKHENRAGFKTPNNTVLPNIGINCSGVLFGIELLFRRK